MFREVLVLRCAAVLLLFAGCQDAPRPDRWKPIPAFPAPDSLPFLPPSAKSFWLVRSPEKIELLCGHRLGRAGWVANRGERVEARIAEYRDAGAQGGFDELVNELAGRSDALQTWHEIHGHRVLHRRYEPDADRGTSPYRSWTGYEWITRVGKLVIQADTEQLMRECLGPRALTLGALPRHVGVTWNVDWSADMLALRDATAQVSSFQSWTYPRPPDDSVRTVTFALFGHGAGARFEARAATTAPRAFREALQGSMPVEDTPRLVEDYRDGVLTLSGGLQPAGDQLDHRSAMCIALTYGVLYVL